VAPVFVDGGEVVAGRAVMARMVSPGEKRMEMVKAGEAVTLNAKGISAPAEVMGLLGADVKGLPRTFAGVEKLTAEQKGKLQAAFGLIDSKKMVEGVLALEGLRKQKVTAAAVVLGRMYQLGIGVKADAGAALACYLEGAVGKDGFALLEYGRMRYGGPKGVRNLPDGVAALVMASEGKDGAVAGAALRMLALVELEGKAVEADVERALAYAERAAKLGDDRAAEAVGMLKKMGE
jgi:TPR repeat protein